jgi:small multidrug resistance pump
VGNLIVIRVVREVGLGPAMSLSAIAQLIVVNLMAVVVFRERLTAAQYLGLALGVVAVALITLPASSRGRLAGPERRHVSGAGTNPD